MSEISELRSELEALKSKVNSLDGGKLFNASSEATQGAFISPASTATSTYPTDAGFTGVAQGGDGWVFDGTTWHFVGVNAGVLQVGINLLGKLLAGAGDVTLDADGITIAYSASPTDKNKLKFDTTSELYNKPNSFGILTSKLGLLLLSTNASGYVGASPELRIGETGFATNYAKFDLNGTLTLYGAATYFDDILGDVTKLKVVGVGITEDTAENAVKMQTSANLSDYVYANYQMPHKRKLSATVYFHIHYEQAENNVPNFLLEYRWQVNGGTKTTAWTRLKCNGSAFTYVSGTLNQIATSTGITPPVGNTLSDILEVRIYRDNANTSTLFAGADPYTTDVLVTSADVHVECDRLGSDGEYTL